MLRQIAVIGMLCIGAMSGGCATVINGTTQRVAVHTHPEGVRFSVDDGPPIHVTPTTVELHRSRGHSLTFTKDGYHTEHVAIYRAFSGSTAGNLLLGGLIGGGIDLLSGGAYALVPEVVHVTMRENSDSSEKE